MWSGNFPPPVSGQHARPRNARGHATSRLPERSTMLSVLACNATEEVWGDCGHVSIGRLDWCRRRPVGLPIRACPVLGWLQGDVAARLDQQKLADAPPENCPTLARFFPWNGGARWTSYTGSWWGAELGGRRPSRVLPPRRTQVACRAECFLEGVLRRVADEASHRQLAAQQPV